MITDPTSQTLIGHLPYNRTVCADVLEQLPDWPVYCLTSTHGDGSNSSNSFLAWDPVVSFTAHRDGRSTVTECGEATELEGDPIDILQRLMDRFSPSSSQALCVSFFSYDLRTLIENYDSPLTDDLDTPLIHLGIFDTYWAIDHANESSQVIAVELDHRRPSPHDRSQSFHDTLCASLKSVSAAPATTFHSEPLSIPEGFSSHFDRNRYMQTVARAQEHIRAGDIYQVNLSQRFSGPLDLSPRIMFRLLMDSTPSPFAAYIELPGMTVLSSSPERLISVNNGKVETRPIKGTRPRGSTKSADIALREELKSSAKDRAENVMIVDVERNDLGRVCETGTIDASKLLEVETYPNVHHLVSVVTGMTSEQTSLSDIIRATFPGGSISGAPKIRAMQIIDELEAVGRGAYTGSVGRFDLNGNMDLNILIRTLVMKDGQAHLSVGGGIVADSDPEAEYEETLHKAAGVFAAIERAKSWS